MKSVASDDQGLAIAAEAMHAGSIVAYPTETSYGLGVDPLSEEAVQQLIAAKDRPAGSAFLLIVADDAQLKNVVSSITPEAQLYMDTFWPGPLSLLMAAGPRLAPSLTGGSPKVCVRCPGHEVARDLCRAYGGAIVSTSANISGEAPALSVDAITLSEVAVAVDGGALAAQPASTIYDPDEGIVLREGVITRHDLAVVREA
jgi:L-threonylcarbamoyladenylate synthase